MCGRYAASARPDELIEAFDVDEDHSGEPARSVLKSPQSPPAGEPDWNMAPKSMAAIPTPASTYMIADYGRCTLESWWVNNLRAANYTRVFNQSAPGGGHAAGRCGARGADRPVSTPQAGRV